MAGKTHRIGKSLIEIDRELGTEQQGLAFLESLRWPDGVRCPKCDGNNISKFTTKETTRKRVRTSGVTEEVRVPSRQLYECLNPECSFQFSVIAGTGFNDSHLPVTQWFKAIGL